MFEPVLQVLLITVLVFLTLFGVLFLWACWSKRDDIKKAWHKSWNNDYSKAELYAKISLAEHRNHSKDAIHWRRRLYEIYPEEVPHGQHHA